jgi:hypothetical protein
MTLEEKKKKKFIFSRILIKIITYKHKLHNRNEMNERVKIY